MTQRLSLFFFLILFPGTFFYSSAVAAGVISDLLGGGFGMGASLVLVALLPLLLFDLVNLRGKALLLSILFFALVLHTIAWLFMHHLVGNPFQQRLDVLFQGVTVVAIWLALFCIGYFWPKELPKGYISILLFCLGCCALIVLLNIDYGQLIFLFGLSDADGALSYQGLARSVSMTGLVLLSVVRSIRTSIIIVITLLTTVFFIGARSELVGVVAVLPFIAYLHFRQRPLMTVSVVLAFTLILASLAVYSYEKLSNSRQFQLFNISESSSGMARANFYSQAVIAIQEKPILGDFAGQARLNGSIGTYAHNVLSAWRQFGLVGFLLYVSLLVCSLAFSLRMVQKRPSQETDLPRIAATLSLFSLILIIGAKSVFWAFPAFTWGLIVACYRCTDIRISYTKSAKNGRFINSCME